LIRYYYFLGEPLNLTTVKKKRDKKDIQYKNSFFPLWRLINEIKG